MQSSSKYVDFTKILQKKMVRNMSAMPQCGNYGNLIHSFLAKTSQKYIFTKEIISDLTKYFFGESKLFILPHCGKFTLTLFWQKFREINAFQVY